MCCGVGERGGAWEGRSGMTGIARGGGMETVLKDVQRVRFNAFLFCGYSHQFVAHA